MIETRTDDSSPSSGNPWGIPLRIADPQDPASYFELDPAGQGAVAAGHARPPRYLLADAALETGIVETGKIKGLATIAVPPGKGGGFYTTPLLVPEEMDTECDAQVTMLAILDSTESDPGTVRLTLEMAIARPDEPTLITHSEERNWRTPEGGSASPGWVELATLPASQLKVGDVVGFVVRREGNSSHDTYDRPVHLVMGVYLRYRARRL